MKSRAPLLGLLAAVVVGIAFYFLLYQPANERQAVLEEETVALEAEQSRLRNQIRELRAIEANQVEVNAALARLEQLIPSGPAQPAAIRQFQAAADAAGVEITSVAFGEPEPLDGAPDPENPANALVQIPVTMVLEGGYFQMVDFLRRVEVEIPRAVLLEGVTIAEGERGFPSLATTWAGFLFAVTPTPPPTADGAPGAVVGTPVPGAGATPTPSPTAPAPSPTAPAPTETAS